VRAYLHELGVPAAAITKTAREPQNRRVEILLR
jgi:hypothetical protein